MARDLYEHVTERIIATLERGVIPWRSPILGKGPGGRPRNLASGREYSGVNVFLLAITGWCEGYDSSRWLTFRQAQSLGGSVKKGEKSTLVVFWKQHEVTDRQSGDKKTVPVLRHFNVFNAEQCEGIVVPDAAAFTPIDFHPIEAAHRIVEGYDGRPAVEHAGNQAYYHPSEDRVRLPEPARFATGEAYYSTLFHELVHSTGHGSRLNRDLARNLHPFGSPDYAKEELVAEMGSAFLCADAAIDPSIIEHQSAYIAGWLRRLRDDKKLVMQAAGAGQKAADWILGTRPLQPSDED